MPAYLEITRRWGRLQREPLEGEQVTIGQSPTNDIVLTEERTVSRNHAVFEHADGAWSIQDLGSQHGTYVNGTRIFSAQALRAGDEIRLGETKVKFHDEDSPKD